MLTHVEIISNGEWGSLGRIQRLPTTRRRAAGKPARYLGLCHVPGGVFSYNGHKGIPMGLDWSKCTAVESVPGKVGGAWVFRGTRLPVAVVFENLEDGLTIDQIVALFDGLTREQVNAVLNFTAQSLEASAFIE